MPPPEFRDQLFQGLRTPGDEVARRLAVRRDASVQEGLPECCRVRIEHQEHRRILAKGPSLLDILRIQDEEEALLENLPETCQKQDRHIRPIAPITAAELSLRRGEPRPPRITTT